MNRLKHFFIFLLSVLALYGCKKNSVQEPEPVFVKLFPGGLYKSAGCFQLLDGNYIIYGVYYNNDGLPPVIIKFDRSGKILWNITLSISFRFVRMKATSDGNILAVGVQDKMSTSVNVCMINDGGKIIHSGEFSSVDSFVAGADYLPDFVEESDGAFTILVSISSNGQKIPFVLKMDNNCVFGPYMEYDGLTETINYFPVSIVHGGDGYAVTGDLLDENEVFFLRLNSDYSLDSQLTISDASGVLSVAGTAENIRDHSTIICGSYGVGTERAGSLYVNRIGTNDSVGTKQPFFDYENLGRFEDIHQTKDGGFILVATVDKLADHTLVPYSKIYLLKLDESLSPVWSRTFNSYNPYTSVSVVQTADEGYLISGFEHTSSYVFSLVVLKTDQFGNLVTE